MPSGVYKRNPGMMTGRYIRTPEYRSAISATLKRIGVRPPSRSGTSLSMEHKQKIRLANTGNKFCLGKKQSKETIAKRVLKLTGRTPSIETRRKISVAQSGEKSVHWRGGLSGQNKLIRASVEFRVWRESVFRRDNWTCRACEVRGGELHPHHVKHFATHIDLRFSLSNGITLCKRCHMEIHRGANDIRKTKA